MAINLPDDYAVRVNAVAHVYRVQRHSLQTLYRTVIPHLATLITAARRNTGALWRPLGAVPKVGGFSVNYLVDVVNDTPSDEPICDLSGYRSGELANMIYVYTRMRNTVIPMAGTHECSERREDCDACADLGAAMALIRGADRVIAELVEEEGLNAGARFKTGSRHQCKIRSQRTSFGIRWHVYCPGHGVEVGMPYSAHGEALRAALDHARTYGGMTTC